LGLEAPVWIPDARVTMCQLCTSEFTLTFRRHHCRCCGKVVCSACSANKAPLPYLKGKQERICDECFQKLEQQLMKLDDSIHHSNHDDDESDETTLTSTTTSSFPWYSIKAMREHFERNQDRKSGRKPKRHVPSVLKEVLIQIIILFF